MTLAQQLKVFYDGKMASSDAFYFGVTPAVLKKAGVNTLPLAFTQADFKRSAKGKHNIPRRVLKNLNSDLETALFAFGSGDRIGILTGDIDGDGKPLLVGIQTAVQMDADKVNAIRSVYGLDNPGPWLQNQIKAGKELVLLDKEKANAFLQTYGAYSASVGDGIRSTGESVAQNGAEVKTKFSLKTPAEETDKLLALHNKDEDSQGRELTEAQREYFKDSKVVDGEGRLLTLYHGTGTEFTVFAIYGIGDGTEATPLYASGGRTAYADYKAFMDAGKRFDYGTDRNRRALNRWFKDRRSKERSSNGGIPDAQGRQPANGHDRVSTIQGEGNGRGSAGYGQQTGGEVNNRYSLKGTEESRELSRLKKETEALKERVSYWKGQTKESTAATTDKKSIEKKARQIVKDYGAQVDTAEIGRP